MRIALAGGGWEWARRDRRESEAQVQERRRHEVLQGPRTTEASLQTARTPAVPARSCISMTLRVPAGIVDVRAPKNFVLTHIPSGKQIRGGVSGDRVAIELPASILATVENALPPSPPSHVRRHTIRSATSLSPPTPPPPRRQRRRKRMSLLACFGRGGDCTDRSHRHTPPPPAPPAFEFGSPEEIAEPEQKAPSLESESHQPCSDALQCPICLDAQVDTVLAPCSHWFCSECAAKFVGGNCAMCRRDVRAALQAEFTDQVAL